MTGSHHMQAFWLPGEHGNEQIEFPFTYLFDDRRWVSRRDVFLVGRDYSKDPSSWNRICIECHVTGRSTPIRPAHRSTNQPRRRARHRLRGVPRTGGAAYRGEPQPLAAPRAAGQRRGGRDHRQSGAACARSALPRCADSVTASAVRPTAGCSPVLAIGPASRCAIPSRSCSWRRCATAACRQQIDADASFAPSRYWRDGMVRVSGREYNGLIESPCFKRGALSCLSCHSMHASDPDRQLGARARRQRSLHPVSSGHRRRPRGAHPPPRRLDADRRVTTAICRIRPMAYCGRCAATRSACRALREELETGRPNACNLCHLDRTLAVDGGGAAALVRYAAAVADRASSARWRQQCSTSRAERPACARSSPGAWAGARRGRRRDGEWMAPLLIELLDDEYAAIRYIAYRSLRRINGFADFQYDYVAAEESRWAAQREARERWSRGGDGDRAARGAAVCPRRPRRGRFAPRRAGAADGRAARRRRDVPRRMKPISQRRSRANAAPAIGAISCATCGSAGRRCCCSPRSGALLELLHALKLPWYLGVASDSRRLMWTLAHAHGVALGLVNLALAAVCPLLPRPTASGGLGGAGRREHPGSGRLLSSAGCSCTEATRDWAWC